MCAPGRVAPGGGGSGLEFRILGPVQAVRGGRELGLGGPRRRAVLALLLVAAGRVDPAERLAEEVWGVVGRGGGGDAAVVCVAVADAAGTGCRSDRPGRRLRPRSGAWPAGCEP